uniref:Uncharacterized protein n=1 Tax=Percolomonas cosmopolitus TaxID=63605 RepID=A0A7S1KSZ1_9EUKA|mmetsp:Transcript_8289/g.30599  ORF Transcript_8289/g.30599 Transcript_8289/m.30599 type:complete len:133 (+) Transcript_8289:53-451(+)|eukprot:CAMPEP_0117441306 /NCGR_PEP_ID=MMETSP0759-20121206/3567_1 /TAXON_ID=63605 /ORGANISM="Percolomonas cosmopolitus, Strain WS" /LENGTH=132 /DNA_ID=CAMNT_0005233157 /DNA_START=32 /DNA_END=430 /DNA_ORIENTATION=+
MSRSSVLIVLLIALFCTALVQAQFYQSAVLGHKNEPTINANDVATPSTQELVMEDTPVLEKKEETQEEQTTEQVQEDAHTESMGGIIGGGGRVELLKNWIKKVDGVQEEEQLATVLDMTSELETLLSQMEAK